MFLEADTISLNILKLMISENIYACRIKNFLTKEKCDHYSKNIINFGKKSYYEVNKSVGKIGSAIFDYAFSVDKIQQYFDLVDENNKNIQTIFGYEPPSKLVFGLLNEIWNSGCEIERFHGKDAYYGIVRIFEKGGSAPPHQDMTIWDIKNCEEVKSIQKQFSVNIYLQTPRNGGEITIYDKHINDEEEYQKTFFRYLDIGYKKAHEEMVNSNTKFITLKPEVGDFIIFNSNKMHSVTNNVSHIPRITNSFFINYRSYQESLRVFS
jgi:hypothetical protein